MSAIPKKQLLPDEYNSESDFVFYSYFYLIYNSHRIYNTYMSAIPKSAL
ncbi:hypothetical protein BD94_1490 [Elizabethkingia anophelis NUHP1]|uniref:Uncharacterized protein n=2 Tax=Elizabethkingia anophelis TaxID=1117645 RepID=A0A455ZGY9_9FLAO|nr:hypothetical protein BD94_1490 [Elizabethkingia anophelis NUHP1]DAC75861.1 TPA_exp: hypothetical protein [Elizabethkingia anophelis]DAC76498.1 TPA_exp: hypothetical protein [Elizabethkingia anophelis]